MMEKIGLGGQWVLSGENLKEPIQGQVPGSVNHDMFVQGLLPDPFYRDNEDVYLAAAEHDYVYERFFRVTPSQLLADEVVLVCKGIDTLSDIIINDQLISSTNNMHRTYEFDVKNVLVAGENTIKIKLYSPLRYCREKHEIEALFSPGEGVKGVPHLRKAHCMFGWDWGPRIPDAGIWRDIDIECRSASVIEEVRFTQNHKEGCVTLGAQVAIKHFGAKNTTLKMFIGGVCKAQSDGQALSADIENPILWQVTGYGEQTLYNVEIKLFEGETEIDSKTYQIGLRTVKIVQNEDQWGKSFYFEVNGIPVFMKGGNYIPEDNLLARCSREKTRKLLLNAKKANHNMVRVWGGGIYPPDYFYEICDELGLLVWQDLMFACCVYPGDEEFLDNITIEAKQNILRISHHACLGLVCGNNECEEGFEHWGWKNKYPHKVGEFIRQYEVVLKGAVKAANPNVFYWPSSASAGGGCYGTRDYDRGDTHYWEVWHFKKPFTEYRKYHFRFASEFGFQSFPSMETIKSFTEDADRNIFSYIMEKHQRHGSANGTILYYLSQTLRYPKDFESLLYASQVLQAEAIRYGVEHWRRNRNGMRCMGSIYWQLNDCWPVASWSSIDYYGRWKALHYSAKRFYAPVLISVCEDGCGAEIHVTNDNTKAFSGHMTWAIKDTSGKEVACGQKDICVEPLSDLLAEQCSYAPLSEGEARRKLYLEYRLSKDGRYVSGGNAYFTPIKHFDLTEPGLKVQVRKEEDGLCLAVSAESLAVYVALAIEGADVIFEDNYFDLSAGETREVRVKFEDMSSMLSEEEVRAKIQIRSLYQSYTI